MSNLDDIEYFDQSAPQPEAPPEPQPWWRLVSRIKWVLGFERPELEVQAFAGVIYAAAEGSSKRVPALKAVAESLQRLRSRPDLPAAMACERLYYDTLPLADLRAELWALRDRLARIATPDALASFRAHWLQDIDNADEEKVLAETHSILGYTHKSYHLAMIREVAAGRVKFRLFFWTIAILLLVATLTWAFAERLAILEPESLFLGFSMIMIAGVIGAVMSIGRRLQGAINSKVMKDDPLFEIAALELGRVGILLSCLIGAIFALLSYLIFYGAIGKMLGLQGGLLPEFSDHMLGSQRGIAAALAFKTDGDMARMLVIAFIAGFAERLVPDAIDRILSQNKDKK
jgi:hypothetical protein